MADKPVKALVTYETYRDNGEGDCWFKVVAPMLEVPNLVPCDFWDKHVKLYVFAQLQGEKPVEVGQFHWNGRTQTPDNEHRISLRSTVKQLHKVTPRFDFGTLTGQAFTIVMALPEQVSRAVQKDETDANK